MKHAQPVKASKTASQAVHPFDPLAKTQQIVDLMKILTGAKEKAVRFELQAAPDCQVFIAGSFNNWDPTSHPLAYRPDKDVFRAYILLEEGTYEYKFIVNGVWQEDPLCPERVANEKGTYNSVIRIHLTPPA